MSETLPRWLEWAREIQALAQTGNHFAVNGYQRERYHRLQEIAAEIFAVHSDLSEDDLLVEFTRQVGYTTPRVDVRGAAFRDGKILMVRERVDGGWTLPGGWADVGDTPADSVVREIFEESGFQARPARLVGVYDANRHGPLEVFHAYKIVFLCDLLSGEATPSAETSQVAFFALGELPQTFSGERTHLRHIQDAFRAYTDPCLPAVFD